MFWLIIWDVISEPLLDLLNTCPTGESKDDDSNENSDNLNSAI